MTRSRTLHAFVAVALTGWFARPLPAQTAVAPPKPAVDLSGVEAGLAKAGAALKEDRLEDARSLLTEVPALPGVAPELEAHRLFQLAVIDQLQAERGAADRDALLARAAETYSRALELDPHAVGALYNLGRVHQMRGDFARADEAYRLAVENAGDKRAFYLRQRADFLAGQNRWSEAEAAYEELVTLDPAQDAPQRILETRYLARRDDPQTLLRYLWRLYGSGQSLRAQQLALQALEQDWPESSQPELLTVFAASLGRTGQVARKDRASAEIARRLKPLAGASPVAEGVRQLLTLWEMLGAWPLANCTWWNRPDLEWAEQRGVARRDAIRAVLRAACGHQRDAGQLDEAAACYRNAVEDPAPDPIALRELAGVYVAQGRIDALDELARRYADPQGAIFEAKNEAYRRGQLETVLQYHRTLGQIYGNLARNGKAPWGDTATPTTALFQLSRAYDVGKRLDDEGKRPTLNAPVQRPWIDGPSHVDPSVAVLLAEGYQATARAEQANAVRLEAAERFERVGDPRARDTVIRAVKGDTLTIDQRRVYERFVPRGKVEVPPTEPKIQPKIDYKVDTTIDSKMKAKALTPAEKGAWDQKISKITIAEGAYVGHQVAKGSRDVQVAADVEWVDTGIDVVEGQGLNISATGQWSNSGPPAVGPNGWGPYDGTVLAGAPIAALIGRVGDRLFLVGAAWGGPAPAAGRLYLGINDTPGNYGDNQGSLAVTIRLE